MIKTFRQHTPQLSGAWLAENATLIGDVSIGPDSSVWYQAVLRGDIMPIKIGTRSNIQDGVIIHTSTNDVPCIVGDNVTVGHGAILHGCTIEDESLIGMNAVILDRAVVAKHCIVGAQALVLEGMQLESGFLYAGVPARKIKALSPQQIAFFLETAAGYVTHAQEQLIINNEK